MTIGELVFNLGFRADTMKLKDFGKAIGDLNMSSIITAGSFGALYEGAKSIIDSVTSAGNSLNQFGRETGQSTEDIQKWTKMAKEMGVSASAISGAVGTAEDSLFKMMRTGEGSQIFNQLKINPYAAQGDVNKLFEMLYGRLHGMPAQLQRYFLEGLHMPLEFMDIFSLSPEKFHSGMNAAAQFKPEDLKKTAEYTQASADLSIAWDTTVKDVAISFIPIVTALKDSLTAIDEVIIKSKTWRDVMIEIAAAVREIGSGDIWTDYKKLADNVFGKGGAISDAMKDPFDLSDPSRALGPATLNQLKEKNNQMNLIVKNTIKSNDAHTSVETTIDNDDSNKKYRGWANQLSQGYY